jgi:hypothetical protein
MPLEKSEAPFYVATLGEPVAVSLVAQGKIVGEASDAVQSEPSLRKKAGWDG